MLLTILLQGVALIGVLVGEFHEVLLGIEVDEVSSFKDLEGIADHLIVFDIIAEHDAAVVVLIKDRVVIGDRVFPAVFIGRVPGLVGIAGGDVASRQIHVDVDRILGNEIDDFLEPFLLQFVELVEAVIGKVDEFATIPADDEIVLGGHAPVLTFLDQVVSRAAGSQAKEVASFS